MKKLLPKALLNNLENIYSKEDLMIVLDGFSTQKRKTSFRVNTLKSNNDEIEKILNEEWIKFEKVDFLENAYFLTEAKEKDLWVLDIFKTWKIYLQSISSQIPVEIMDIQEWDKILDITASPWWKTTQAAAKLNNTWKIVAVDNNAIRIDKLNFTINRQWAKNVEVIKTDARKLIENTDYIEFFDKIIADLPCSAEGKINLNIEKSYAYWYEWLNKKNYNIQKDIIRSIIPLLKKWWELVYSTCTISPLENEDIVHMILSNYPEMSLEEINLDYEYMRDWVLSFWKKVYKKEMLKTKRVLASPESEWFFVARFRKN